MSGHSKWATIKRKKAATDQARAVAITFSDCSRGTSS
jgi:transcriptional/translational regulatory protein YebC/TACO1